MAAGLLTLALLAAGLLASVDAGKHDVYAGQSVHAVELRDAADAALLRALEERLGAALDVWQHGAPGAGSPGAGSPGAGSPGAGAGGRPALVMAGGGARAELLAALDMAGVPHRLHLQDVARAFEEHDAEMARYRRGRAGRLVPFEDYPRYDEVDAYLERVAAEHPDLVTLVNAGNSFEGRAIKYLKISSSNFTDTSKPVYYMDAMIHAREWVTTPTALYAIHRLVEQLRDEDRDLLQDLDWIILPLVNPDGYEFSHTDFRLWRRTRSYYPAVSEECYGVDANRNFDVAFNTVGVSADPCSDVYPGHEPFSEPETRLVRDILLEHVDRLQLYMNIHSHGNWILFGYGNTTLPSNVAQIHHVGAAMGAAMDAVKLPEASYYLVGNSAFLLYSTSGSAQDYGQAVGVPFSYTLELPGYGFDFRVPPQYIEHINSETWRGLAATARLARAYHRAAAAAATATGD